MEEKGGWREEDRRKEGKRFGRDRSMRERKRGKEEDGERIEWD